MNGIAMMKLSRLEQLIGLPRPREWNFTTDAGEHDPEIGFVFGSDEEGVLQDTILDDEAHLLEQSDFRYGWYWFTEKNVGPESGWPIEIPPALSMIISTTNGQTNPKWMTWDVMIAMGAQPVLFFAYKTEED